MHSGTYKQPKPVYRGKWQTVRKRILERDNHTCQIGLPGCTVHANTVDHITPVSWGGSWYDQDNLRAACKHCNSVLGTVAQKHAPRPADGPTAPIQTTVVPSRQW